MMTLPDFKEKKIIMAFVSRGEKLSFKNDNVVITDSDGQIKHQSTCYRLFAIFLIGHITITSGLIQRAKRFGFSIILMTHSLKVYDVLSSGAEGNVLLRKKQYSFDSLDIAKHLVLNKINNQILILKNIRNKSNDLKESIRLLNGYAENLTLENLGLKQILGIEGIAARVYFSNLFSDCGWTARRPRVKHDIINCLMDIGYTLLFNVIEAMLSIYGFDIYHGVYHQQFYQRKSLVCDLVEPFRPLIDAKIKKAINLKQCNEDDFDIIQGKYFLFGKKSAPYLNWLMEPLLERKDDMFVYIREYYRAFMRNKDISKFPSFNIVI